MSEGPPRWSSAPRAAICIPVRDEAARLPRLFDAIELLDRADIRLCLLLDGCTDASGRIAADYARRSRFPVHIGEAPPSPPNAGAARHGAMRLGLEALGAAGGMLFSTDADSWPREDWVAAMIVALSHADVVAGRVVRTGSQASGEQDRIDAYYDRLFALRRRLDPVGWEATATHHQTSGANMGMSAETYVAAGGFLPLPGGEDARFVDDAARAGLHVRRDAGVVVYTSDRREGRAMGGMAETLRDLDREGLAGITVAHPADAMWQYRLHRTAREAFETGRFDALAAPIGLHQDHLIGVARDCPDAEAFAMRVVPVPPGGMRHVPLAIAEAALTAAAAAAAIADDAARAA